MQYKQKTFAHRYTDNDEIESICLTCYVTFARSRDESEMLNNEARHECQPAPLPLAFHFQEA
jgi:hypothetical protein